MYCIPLKKGGAMLQPPKGPSRTPYTDKEFCNSPEVEIRMNFREFFCHTITLFRNKRFALNLML